MWWNVTSGRHFDDPTYGGWWSTIGALGDLAYEYMFKTWLLSGGQDEVKPAAAWCCMWCDH